MEQYCFRYTGSESHRFYLAAKNVDQANKDALAYAGKELFEFESVWEWSAEPTETKQYPVEQKRQWKARYRLVHRDKLREQQREQRRRARERELSGAMI